MSNLHGLVLGSLPASVTADGHNSGAPVLVATVTPVVTPNTVKFYAHPIFLNIYGVGFSSNAANDKVTFSGGATGTVTSATSTQLTVTNLNGLLVGNLSAAITVSGPLGFLPARSSTSVQVATVTPTIFASGFTDPVALAFDAAGNLYVSDGNTETVSEVTPAGVVSTFASGFNAPVGMAFDAAGNLYVANYGNGTVSEVTPAGVVSTFASGFSGPVGLAFDAAGNLYVANAVGNTVSKVAV